MAAKKVYAVRRGKVTGILDSWDACKDAVDVYPGAEYKSFKTLEEARAYLEGQADMAKPLQGEVTGPVHEEANEENRAAGRGRRKEKLSDRENRPRGMGDPAGGLVAYVDGSYEHSVKKYAFGCVFILPDDRVYVENGSGSNPDTAQQRNVSGEMLGAMYAVRWAIKNGFSQIELRYDYEGIEKWVTGAWKSRTELTQKYAAAMRRWKKDIQMRFTKVTAHSSVYYNELADRLAKDGLVERDEIPEVWRMEEMEPWAD
ncbi:MAG: ribonuclease H family protein [Acetatifactor sp.]|nr:ribonuclease H family protein [Acetatifactor sp.]